VKDVTDLRAELRHALDRGAKWLDVVRSLRSDGALRELPGGDEDLQRLRSLRTRAASALINVAMIGGYSSGKSFLVSALQRKLEYAPLVGDDGLLDDKYIGLLPAASQPTTACPASVVPVEPSVSQEAFSRGYLRVRFTDSDEWEDMGELPPPLIVAAYATQDANLIVAGRKKEHRDRVVAEIEILLSDVLLPAKFYDLPGYGSPHPVHDEIVRDSMAEADCFLYVTQATHTLSDAELTLIKKLYDHHVYSGKRVIWVVTGIDRARELGLDNRPAWETTAIRNMEYLNEHFHLSGNRVDIGFIGQGFMPVSPAFEARGYWHLEKGDIEQGNRLIAASRMKDLRSILKDMINTDTGHRHIANVAREALALIAPRQRVLAEVFHAARLPLEELGAEREALGNRLDNLEAAIDTNRSQLENMLRSRIRLIERQFSTLARHLHDTLDEEILSADLTKPTEANQIEVHKTQVLQEWAARPGGPVTQWEAEFDFLKLAVFSSLRNALRDSDPLGDLGVAVEQVDLDQLTVPPSRRHRSTVQDVVQKTAAFVSTITPVATGVTAALGVVTGPMLLVPAGVAAGAGVLYGAIKRHKSKSTSLDLLRGEWIEDLDAAAEHYRQAFMAVLSANGMAIIDRAGEFLAERSIQLSRKIMLIEERMADPENVDRKSLIDRLAPCCQEGAELVATLRVLGQA
jgi:hypothetical protein